MIKYKLDVDVVPGGRRTEAYLNQYDEDYTLEIHLFASRGELTIPSGTTATIRGTKSDGNGYDQTVAVDAESMVVTVSGDIQMSAVAGRSVYEVSLFKDGKRLSTANFDLIVERAALDKDTVASDSKIRQFSEVYDDHADEIINAGAQYAAYKTEMVALESTARAAAESTAQDVATASAATKAVQTTSKEATEALNSVATAAIQQIDNKAEAVAAIALASDTLSRQALDLATMADNEAAEASTIIAQLRTKIQELENARAAHIAGLTVANGALYGVNEDGDIITDPVEGINGTGGGGGGGSVATSNLTISNTSGFNSKTITESDDCPLSFSWSSVESEMPTGNGTLRVMVNGVVKAIMDVAQGQVTVDVAPYLTTGANNVRLTVVDMYDNSRFTAFNITRVDLSLSSKFDSNTPYTGAISFPYTPNGSVEKTIRFKLDGVEIGTNVTSVSGRQMSFTIPQQRHGPHTFECYFEATINGQSVESNHLYYEIICIETLNTTPIIVSDFNQSKVTQYTTLHVDYTVYDPAKMEAPVTITANGVEVATLTVDRTQQVFTYRADTVGDLTIVIKSGQASKTFTLTVTDSGIKVEAETDQLVLHLSSAGRSNNEAHPEEWSFGTGSGKIAAQMTGFNWARNGWVNDEDGITALRVMGGAKVDIPFHVFEKDPRASGLTVEIEFATHNVMDYDAVVLSCMSGNRGLQMTAQQALLRAEQTEVVAQYKENEHIRVTYVIEKRSKTRVVYIYIDAEMIGVSVYPENDNFAQASPVGITIGSDQCGVDIYNIRVYENDLTWLQVQDNWIADAQDVGLMLERYNQNNVYDEYGNIVIAKLPQDLPYMVIECAELPQYKGDKKDVNITYVDRVTTTRSFNAELAQADVQGTSSQYYEVKNFKIKFKNGFVVNGSSADKYPLRVNAIPVSTFTFKADVASSEGVNNVELVRLYDELAREVGALTPPQKSDARVQQGIDGFPIVVFWNNGTDTVFVGKYNFNNDKGTEELYGFTSGDESWETSSNTSMLSKFKTDTFGENWAKEDYEGRYPDGSTNNTNLQAMTSWVYSTWQENATGDALATPYEDVDSITHTVDNAAYRLAKFKTELENWFDLNDTTFYYLFTLHFLMVDSRQKNAFPTRWASTGKWMWLPYDFDTALGTDNRGALAFNYNLEDIDMNGNEYVFNGQDSVFWVNFRQAFFDRVRTMYQTLRSSGKFDFDYVEGRFEEHQAKWPTAIFNEDSYYKYLRPLVRDGNAAYLAMLQGSKRLQRKFWLSNRFDYMDSLFTAGNALTSYIMIRPYYNITEAERAGGAVDLTITPYADIYATVQFDATRVQVRTTRGTPTVIHNPLSYANDAVVSIYSANALADVGDLAPLHLGYADFARATKLQRIKVGDAASSYENDQLKTLSVGTNPLLKVIDARNCTALGSADMKTIDVSNCPNIEELYFDGTVITGIDLPNGGILRKIHLPATVASLIIRNQPSITELVIPSYANISTLWLENVSGAVDEKAILKAIPASSRVRLTGINWECADAAEIDGLLDILDTMIGMDAYGNNTEQAQVSGTIHTYSLTGAEIAGFNARYPYIEVTADHVTSYLTYKNYDGSSTIKTVTCIDGVPQESEPSGPSRSSTAQYSYTFVGWNTQQDAQTVESGATTNVQADRTVYAAYSRTTRTYTVTWKNADGTTLETDTDVPYGTTPTYNGATPTYNGQTSRGWTPAVSAVTGNVTYTASYIPTYTVRFYNGSTLLDTVTVQQGGTAAYTGTTPTKTGVDNPEDYTFKGWSPSPTNIQANTDCYAQFKFNGVPTATTADGAYGVEWDYSNSDPALTRKGLAASFTDPAPATSLSGSGSSPFDNIAPWKDMKRYNIIDGAVSYSEDDAGFSETDYDTVVYIPEFYYTAYKDTENSKWLWAISPTAKQGYVKHPGSGRYLGRYHTTGTSSDIGVKSGVNPLANTSITNFSTYAANKGAEWFLMDIATWSALQLLYLVEFANFDSQTVLGAGNNSGSIKATGITDNALYHTLKVTGDSNQYRWIENPFSNLSTWLDGFYANTRTPVITEDNTTRSVTANGKTSAGVSLPSTNGCIQGFGYSEEFPWAFIPDTSDGSTDYTKYVCDRVYWLSSSNPFASVGGNCSSSALFGFFYLSVYYTASATNAYVGSRLLYKS